MGNNTLEGDEESEFEGCNSIEEVNIEQAYNNKKQENPLNTAATTDSSFLPLYIPGYAYRVDAEITSGAVRDVLQRAILGLMRITSHLVVGSIPNTTENIASELCLELPIIENALRTLCDEGIVIEENGIYQLTPDPDRADDGILERRDGWLFWCPCINNFLNMLVLGPCPDPAEKADNVDGWQAHPGRNELRQALRHASLRDISVYTCRRVGKNADIVTEKDISSDIVIKGISLFSKFSGKDYPLVVPVEIRPRISGTPGIFFRQPHFYLDLNDLPDYTYNLESKLHEYYPLKLEAIENEGVHINNDYFLAKHAPEFAKLGGKDKIVALSEEAVSCNLHGVVLRPQFDQQELRNIARDAEIKLLLSNNGVAAVDVHSLRWDFVPVLQTLGRILSDEAAALLRERFFLNAFERIQLRVKEDTARGENNAWRRIVSERLKQLNLDYCPWDLGRHKYNDLRAEVNNEGSRHQLGNAFLLWLLPPILDSESPEGRAHLNWIRAVQRQEPNILSICHETIQQRNIDKTYRSDGMPVNQFRENIYRIWRTIGA